MRQLTVSYRQNPNYGFCRYHYQSMAGVHSLAILAAVSPDLTPGDGLPWFRERILILLLANLLTITLTC
jgi:hypothetical protein